MGFLNAMDKEKTEINFNGNKIEIRSPNARLSKVFADVFRVAEDRLRDYVERKTGVEEPDSEDAEQKKVKENLERISLQAEMTRAYCTR